MKARTWEDIDGKWGWSITDEKEFVIREVEDAWSVNYNQ